MDIIVWIVAALTPRPRSRATWATPLGLQARLMSRAAQLTGSLQVRSAWCSSPDPMKIGVMFGQPGNPTAAIALKFTLGAPGGEKIETISRARGRHRTKVRVKVVKNKGCAALQARRVEIISARDFLLAACWTPPAAEPDRQERSCTPSARNASAGKGEREAVPRNQPTSSTSRAEPEKLLFPPEGRRRGQRGQAEVKRPSPRPGKPRPRPGRPSPRPRSSGPGRAEFSPGVGDQKTRAQPEVYLPWAPTWETDLGCFRGRWRNCGGPLTGPVSSGYQTRPLRHDQPRFLNIVVPAARGCRPAAAPAPRPSRTRWDAARGACPRGPGHRHRHPAVRQRVISERTGRSHPA